MTQHTAGDWETGVPSPMGIAVQTIMKSPSGEFPICVPLAWCQTQHCVAATQFYYVAVEEAVANARLMAAAPELLEACETLLFVVMKAYQQLPDGSPEHNYWRYAYIEPARDAIRKATERKDEE